MDGEAERGARLLLVGLTAPELTELLTDGVLLKEDDETTLVALRVARFEVALLLIFAFGLKVGDGAEGKPPDLYGEGERLT